MLSVIDNSVGFFKHEHVKLCKTLSDLEMSNFSSLASDTERFAFVYSLREKLSPFPGNAEDSSKNVETAKQMKQNGNAAFKAGDMSKALHFYTKSLLKYPHDEENRSEVAIVYANRSAALHHQGEHKLCINDIQLALEYDYPKNMRYKILERKARSLLAMKQLKSALEAFRNTFVALDDAKVPPEERRKLQTNMQIMMAMMTKDQCISDKEQVRKTEKIQTDYGNNATYKSASSAVRFTKNDEMGRYAEAQQNIEVGSTILVEEPHSSVLLEDNAETHCFHCFKRFTVPIPCTQCGNIAFCSKECQAEALNSYHRYECKVLRQLWASKASITCLIALRIIMQKPLDHFLKLKTSLEETAEYSESKEYSGLDYSTIYNLVRHESLRTAEDLLHRSHMAVFLFKCLQRGGYFSESATSKNSKNAELTADETYIGSLLLRHIQMLQFNAHEVSELVVPEKAGLNDGQGRCLGAAIFSTLALLNHSCDPSIVRYYQGTKVVVHTIKQLKKGEMITENYGPIYMQTVREERQRTLKNQYWFICECVPCIENWPTFDEMNDEASMRFRCESKSCSNVIIVPTSTLEFLITCAVCKKVTNIIKGLKVLQDTDSKFAEGQTFLERGDTKKALKTFSELLKILDATLAPPFKGYALCQQALKTCYLHLGNKIVESKNKSK